VGREYLLIAALLVVAVGAALLLGTGAAMVQVKRTGRAPDRSRQHTGSVATPGVVTRLVIGAVIIAAGGWGVWRFFA
jgi:hypothetical protein